MKGRKEKSKIIDFLKNHKKVLISLIVVVTFLGFFLTINYGRYVKDIIEVYYLRTKNFYFNSDKLTIIPKEYEISPWSGAATDPLKISISMDSLLNSMKGTSTDINYKVTCDAVGEITCSIEDGKTDRTILTAGEISPHKDAFNVIVAPKEGVELKEGESVKVTVTAESTSPYKEVLSAKFIIVVGNYGVSYVIEDNLGDIYFNDIITNTLADKSTRVTLTIKDTQAVRIDMSSKIFSLGESGGLDYNKDDDGFINSVTFLVGPKSSMLVRFYKTDSNIDYSHNSYNGESSIIGFESVKVDSAKVE